MQKEGKKHVRICIKRMRENHHQQSSYGEEFRMAIKLDKTLFSCLSEEDKCLKKYKIM